MDMMSNSHAIPSEIAHLDFAPKEEATEEGITRGQECRVINVYRRKWFRSRRARCHNLATWEATLRCCMVTFPCCGQHRDTPVPWVCPECGHDRGDEWVAWRPLT